MLKHTPLAHTQTAVRSQAVAPYPKSFNDHKEAPRLVSLRRPAIVPTLLPLIISTWSQAWLIMEAEICQRSPPCKLDHFANLINDPDIMQNFAPKLIILSPWWIYLTYLYISYGCFDASENKYHIQKNLGTLLKKPKKIEIRFRFAIWLLAAPGFFLIYLFFIFYLFYLFPESRITKFMNPKILNLGI